LASNAYTAPVALPYSTPSAIVMVDTIESKSAGWATNSGWQSSVPQPAAGNAYTVLVLPSGLAKSTLAK